MSREDELMRIVRETRGDDAAFEAALVEHARATVQDVLDALCGAAEIGRRVMSYAELAALGRRLAAAAALVAGEEEST